mmetsp:Transcript_810/g.1732  ORF Transcript_810/g.1732 Transcript_810/m.1732 type:complete len:114 (-) Transcript_810:190-531(-)
MGAVQTREDGSRRDWWARALDPAAIVLQACELSSGDDKSLVHSVPARTLSQRDEILQRVLAKVDQQEREWASEPISRSSSTSSQTSRAALQRLPSKVVRAADLCELVIESPQL